MSSMEEALENVRIYVQTTMAAADKYGLVAGDLLEMSCRLTRVASGYRNNLPEPGD
jgi:hypothetical protein